MAQSDELMKGFQVGYQNAPFASLGQAIKSTLGRLQEREDTTSQLVTKAGIDQMFQDPLDRQYKQAQIQNAQDQGSYRQGMLDVANRRVDTQAKRYTALDIQKNKDFQNLQDTSTNYALQRKDIEDALSSLQRIPKGIIGQKMLGAKGAMGSQDPVLKDMQSLRSILGSETLKGRAGMPGAMSDADRAFLQEMAANTGTLSVPRIQEVLSRNLNKINALEDSMKNTYNIKYNTFGGFGGRTAEDGDFDSIMFMEE